MNRVLTWTSYCIGVLVLSACSTLETPQQAQEGDISAQDPTQVQFDRPLHFSAPDGSDVVVPVGSYRVEQATGSQIRLVPSGEGLPTLLSAEAVPTDLDMVAPFALALPFEQDAYDLVLVVPGGPALETRGSVSGVQPRGGSSQLKAILVPPLSLEVLDQSGPDLMVSMGDGLLCWVGSSRHEVGFRVFNNGTAFAGRSGVLVNPYYPLLPVFLETNELRPGQSQYFRFVHNCKPSDYNRCPISVKVDPGNRVAESSETNNVASTKCTVLCRLPEGCP